MPKHKYHIILNSIMDRLAPLKKKRIKDMTQPWYDELLSNEIQLEHLKEEIETLWKQVRLYCSIISEEMCRKDHSCQTNSTTMTCSVTSAEIPKGYIQRPTNYSFKSKNYPYLMKMIQKYWLKDSSSSSHQRLKRLWQLWFLQIHIQLMNPT